MLVQLPSSRVQELGPNEKGHDMEQDYITDGRDDDIYIYIRFPIQTFDGMVFHKHTSRLQMILLRQLVQCHAQAQGTDAHTDKKHRNRASMRHLDQWRWLLQQEKERWHDENNE